MLKYEPIVLILRLLGEPIEGPGGAVDDHEGAAGADALNSVAGEGRSRSRRGFDRDTRQAGPFSWGQGRAER